MRKFLLVIAVCLLGLTVAFAQSNSSASPAQQSPSAQQAPSAQQSPGAQPSQPQQTPKSGDTSVSGSSSSNASPNANSSTADQNGQQGQKPSRAANNGGGLPWGWIIIGIVAVVILVALATRGSDRVDRTTTVERRDDDIRRVG